MMRPADADAEVGQPSQKGPPDWNGEAGEVQETDTGLYLA